MKNNELRKKRDFTMKWLSEFGYALTLFLVYTISIILTPISLFIWIFNDESFKVTWATTGFVVAFFPLVPYIGFDEITAPNSRFRKEKIYG